MESPTWKHRSELKRLHSVLPGFRSILKRRDLLNMAEAIKNNLAKLREDYGEDKVEQHLATIAKYHGRESYSLDN